LLHLVVIVVVIRCRLSSCDVTHRALSRIVVCRHCHTSSSCVVVIYYLCILSHITSMLDFVMYYCTSSSYVAIVHCHRQV